MPTELTLEERIAQRRAAKTTASTASLDERIAARRAARPRGRTPEQLAANPPLEPTRSGTLSFGAFDPLALNPVAAGALAVAGKDQTFDSPERRIKRADKEGVSPATLRTMEKRKKEREAEAAKGRAVGSQRQYEAGLREGTVNERQVETNRRASEIMARADEVARRRAAEKQQKMGLLGAATEFGTEPQPADLTASPYLGTAVDVGEAVFGEIPSIETSQDVYAPTANMAANAASQLGQAVLTGGASGAGRIAQGIRGLQATRGGRAALGAGIGASQVLRSTGLEDPAAVGTGALMGVLGGTIGAEKARDVLGVLGADAAATLADMVRADPELAMRIAEGRMLPGDEEMLVQAGLSSALPSLAGSALELGQRSIGRRYQEGVNRAQEEARQQRVGLSEKARLGSDARLRGYEEQGDLDAAVLEEMRLRADQDERAALEGAELRRGVFDEEMDMLDRAQREYALGGRIDRELDAGAREATLDARAREFMARRRDQRRAMEELQQNFPTGERPIIDDTMRRFQEDVEALDFDQDVESAYREADLRRPVLVPSDPTGREMSDAEFLRMLQEERAGMERRIPLHQRQTRLAETGSELPLLEGPSPGSRQADARREMDLIAERGIDDPGPGPNLRAMLYDARMNDARAERLIAELSKREVGALPPREIGQSLDAYFDSLDEMDAQTMADAIGAGRERGNLLRDVEEFAPRQEVGQRRPAILEPLTPEEEARGDWYVPERGGQVSPELAARLRARIEESAPAATLDDLLRNVRTRDYPYGERALDLLERARELDQPRIEERDRRIEEMRQQLRRGERPKTRLSGRQRRGDRGFIGFPTLRSRRPHVPMPATDANRSSFDADAPQAPRTAWAKRTWDAINRNFLDQYAALKKFQEKYGGTPYDWARNAGYADGRATAYIEDGIIDPVTGARTSEGLKKIIARPLSSTDPKATLLDETLAKRFSTYTNALRVLDVASRPQQMPADEPASNVAAAAQAIGLKSPEAKRVIAGKLSPADLSTVIEQINKFTGADGMAEKAIFGELVPDMDINQAQQIVGEMEGAYDNARTIARELSDYSNALLRNQVAMGDLSPQDYRRIVARNEWYFPLYRVTDGSELDDLGLTSPSYTGGKSFAQVPKSPKKLKGSQLQVIPVLDSLVRKTFDSVNYANRSAVFNSVADTIDRVTAETSDPDLLPFRRYDGEVKEDQSHPGKLRGKNGEFVIRGRRNGEEQMYAVEPEVYAAMHAMGARSGSGFWETVIRGLGSVRGLQAAGITAALPFTIANAVIDAPTAFLQSEIRDWRGKTPFYHLFRGMMLQAFPSLRKSAARQAFGQSGIRGTNELRNVDTRRDPGEVTRQITGRVGTGRKAAAAVTLGASEVGRGLYTVLRGISDRIEAAPRMAEFEGVFEQELAAGKSYKDATLAATRAAQDVTVDFRRGGTAAKEINRVSLFFNPAIQGMLREVENFKKRPAKTLAKMGVVFGLPALASMLTVAGDEEYWQIPESDRARYFYFPNPRYDESDPDSAPYLRMPKPRGPMAQAMIQGMEATFGTLVRMRAQGIPFDAEMMVKASPNMKRLLEAIENPQQADETAKRMLGAFLTSFISAAEPALEVMQDYDYFRERPILGRREKDLAPELQYKRNYTNPAYVFAAKRLAESGINLSPAIVQHLVDGYGGTLARDAADLLGTAAVKLGGQEKTLPLVVGKKPPIIGRFLGSKAERGSQQVQDFWDEYGRFTRTQRSYRALKNEGRFTDAREFKERNAALLDRNAEIEKAYKRMEIQFGIIERAMATARKEPSKEDASKAKIDAASKRIGDIGLEYWKKFGDRKAFER